MEKYRIAVPTRTHEGLEDTVSKVFGKAKTFTIIDVEDNKVEKVNIIDNPAASYPAGAGPIAVKTLADLKVNLVIAFEFGIGASTLLEHHNIRTMNVKPDIKVADSVKDILERIHKNYQEN